MDTSAKFVSDEDSFWYQVHFDDIYCVDQVMSLDSDIYTHTWSCMESGCGDPCEGRMCKYVDVTVLNESNGDENENISSRSSSCGRFSSTDIPANCGDGVRISISKENAKYRSLPVTLCMREVQPRKRWHHMLGFGGLGVALQRVCVGRFVFILRGFTTYM